MKDEKTIRNYHANNVVKSWSIKNVNINLDYAFLEIILNINDKNLLRCKTIYPSIYLELNICGDTRKTLSLTESRLGLFHGNKYTHCILPKRYIPSIIEFVERNKENFKEKIANVALEKCIITDDKIKEIIEEIIFDIKNYSKLENILYWDNPDIQQKIKESWFSIIDDKLRG